MAELDTSVYNYTQYGMDFKVTVTTSAASVEKWIHDVKPRLNADRKSTRLNSSHITRSRMPSSA